MRGVGGGALATSATLPMAVDWLPRALRGCATVGRGAAGRYDERRRRGAVPGLTTRGLCRSAAALLITHDQCHRGGGGPRVSAPVVDVGTVCEIPDLGLQSSALSPEIGCLATGNAYDLVLGRHQFCLATGGNEKVSHLPAKPGVSPGLPTGGVAYASQHAAERGDVG